MNAATPIQSRVYRGLTYVSPRPAVTRREVENDLAACRRVLASLSHHEREAYALAYEVRAKGEAERQAKPWHSPVWPLACELEANAAIDGGIAEFYMQVRKDLTCAIAALRGALDAGVQGAYGQYLLDRAAIALYDYDYIPPDVARFVYVPRIWRDLQAVSGRITHEEAYHVR